MFDQQDRLKMLRRVKLLIIFEYDLYINQDESMSIYLDRGNDMK